MRNSMPATLPQPPASASPTRTELSVTGMTCQNCARHVGEALQTVPGVGSATVSLQDQRASVRWLPQAAPDHSALIESLRDAGYTGQLIEPSQQKSEHECHSSAWESTLWLALAATAYLMLGEWGLGLQRQGWFRWSAFAVATLVQVFAGSHFYQGAWNQLKLGRSNMDTLVALGSSTAYLYSVFLLFSGSSAHLYFM